jgi:AcrR family transcriptional regulator
MPRQKQRTEELRDRILETAVDLIATEGVSGFTTRRIVEEASTSIPAMYELFGDKSGLVREIFFEGFRQLRSRFDVLELSEDPRQDLVSLIQTFRRFYMENPILARVMFSRPFPDFDPGPAEEEAGRSVREHVVSKVQRAIDAQSSKGARPTSPMSSWLWRRAWRLTRSRAGSAPRRPP